MELTLDQLLVLVEGRVLLQETARDSPPRLTGFATLAEAGAGDLSFFGNERYLSDLRKTRAAVVLVPGDFSEDIPGVILVAVNNPSASFGLVVERFCPPKRPFSPGVHPLAVIDPSVEMDPEKVCIGPFVVLEAGVKIGDGTGIAPGCFVGEGTKIGRNCQLHARVTVYHHCEIGDRVGLHSGVVLGADGFGYEFVDGRHRKIDQVGIVRVDDDVEIGANTTVDRARFGRTWIKEGAKIDNQVQIAHNCVIGRHAIVISQAGIAGSTKVGDHAVIAAQAGVAGHLEIGPQVVVAAQSGVTKSLLSKGQYMGFPATPVAEMRRQYVHLRKIGNLLERVAALEKAKPPEPAPPPA